MNHAAQIAIVLVGTLMPAAFFVFVLSVTRRGGEFKKLDTLLPAIARLREELHKAFAADQAHTAQRR